MYAFIQTVYIMYGMSEMYISLLYNTHIIVLHTRISFSAEKSHCIAFHVFNLVHNLSTLQIIFPVHSLDSGSEFPFAI